MPSRHPVHTYTGCWIICWKEEKMDIKGNPLMSSHRISSKYSKACTHFQDFLPKNSRSKSCVCQCVFVCVFINSPLSIPDGDPNRHRSPSGLKEGKFTKAICHTIELKFKTGFINFGGRGHFGGERLL